MKQRPDAILLPAPIHQSETDSFGFNAPTTSTTMALALGDALAVVISNELHPNVQAVFSSVHPGGAIGQAVSGPKNISELTIPYELIPEMEESAMTGAHVLMSAYRSQSGWVRRGDQVVVPPRLIRRLQPDDMDEPAVCIEGLMVERKDWIEIPAETSIVQAKGMVLSWRTGTNAGKYGDDAILVTMVEGEVAGIVEVGTLMG